MNNSLFYQTFMIYMYLINGEMAMIKRKIYLLINTLRVNDSSVFVYYKGLSNVEGQKC